MKNFIFMFLASLLSLMPHLDAHKPPKIRNETTGIVYSDLQTAINDASSSDTLKIDGKCVGNFSILQTLTLVGGEDAVLDGNNAGPVLDLTGNGTITVTLDHLAITNGATFNGGAINNITTLVVKNSKVYGNTASQGGGAIFNATSSAISFGPGSVTIIKSHLFNNSTSVNGGAIQTTGGGTLTIFQSKLSANEADGIGGAVHSINSTTVITESKIERNNAKQNGGGLYNDTGSTATVTQSKIEQNLANEGAGIFNEDMLVINQSSIETNSATTNGGGVYNDSTGNVTFQFSKVIGNVASNGGGIYNVHGGTVNFVKSNVENNIPNDFITE